jgi:hypothetical protein
LAHVIHDDAVVVNKEHAGSVVLRRRGRLQPHGAALAPR